MTSPSPTEPIHYELGRHVVRFEPPDLLYCKYMGAFGATEGAEMLGILHEVGDRFGPGAYIDRRRG